MVASALLALTALAWGQAAPEGAHHTTVGPGAGLSSGGSPTGGYATEVALDLPSPRGPLPVPLSVAYTGSGRAGAAGAGWDIPLSYVRRQTSTWRRRPSFLSADPNVGAERISVALDGSPQLMVPHNGAYIPHAGGAFMELSRSGAGWKLRTLDNLEYVFEPASSIYNTSPAWTDLWLLTEVRDLVGTDKVVLRYDTSANGTCDPELNLSSLAYTFDSQGTPLYEIALRYDSFWTQEGRFGTSCHRRTAQDGSAEVAARFESVRDDAVSFARSRVLSAVEVRARNNHRPELGAKTIRAYQLTYAPDADTGKPRLQGVTRTGEEGLPGLTLPVANYRYGSVTRNEIVSGDPLLEFAEPVPVPRSAALPSQFLHRLATTETDVEDLVSPAGVPLPWDPRARGRRETARARQLVRDFTGDGLADLVYKHDGAWVVIAGRLDPSGRFSLDGLASYFSEPAELHVETTVRFEPPTSTDPDNRWARQAMITTETWTDFVDWNGDGRLDVVDTRGGQNERYWKIWLNHKAPNGGILWRPYQVDINKTRLALASKGYGQHDLSSVFPSATWWPHLPLTRSRSWPRVRTWACTKWECQTVNGDQQCASVACERPDDWAPVDAPPQVDTMTEWTIADKNGDGYPDFVAASLPVRLCEQNIDNGWNEVACAADPPQSPADLFWPPVDGPVGCSTEHREWIGARSYSAHDQPELAAACGGGGVERVDAGELVYLNRQGPYLGFLLEPFAATPIGSDGGAPSGVTHWTTGADSLFDGNGPAEGLSWQAAGIRARTDGTLGFRRATELAGNRDLPAFYSDRHVQCHGLGEYHAWQTQGEADLNGDGLADQIYVDDYLAAPADRHWYVRFNTGVGWAPPREILSPGNAFAISESWERCHRDGQTTSGLTDLDGDGIPELVRVMGGELHSSTLRVGVGDDTLSAGRLIAIDNGYGAETYIRYANAKADPWNAHDIPYPEIVVWQTGTRVAEGTDLAPVYYAYGDGSLTYDALAGQWSFTGYRKQLVLTGTRYKEDQVEGVIGISERSGPAQPGAPWATQVTSQQVVASKSLEGVFHVRVLGSYLASTPPAFAEASATFAAKQIAPSPTGFPVPDCADLEPVYATAVGTGRCDSGGVVYNAAAQGWEGTAAPPSLQNTLAGSSTEEVDGFGRATRMRNSGDLRRTDDDVCTTLTYAVPANGSAFPSVPSAMVVTDCGLGSVAPGGIAPEPGTPQILSVVRFFYDNQPHGAVARGRLTSREVDRYDENGFLDTHRVEELFYDGYGEVAKVVIPRYQGTPATHIVSLARDPFGATVTATKESASDVGGTFTGEMRVSSWPSEGSQTTDQSGVTAQIEHDGEGRPVREFVVTSTGRNVLKRYEYDDELPGRSVTVEVFGGDTELGDELTTTDKQRAFIELDALGRPRFTLRALGADYSETGIVEGLVDYDELGRVRFAAAPFATSASPYVPDLEAAHFGTAPVYDRRGRVIREVTAHGAQPDEVQTSVDANVFVRSYLYSYYDGKAVTTVTGTDESDPGSMHHNARDQRWLTATGREVRRERRSGGGTRLDLVEQEWDRLGRITTLRRFLEPHTATGAVEWRSTYDSLGRRLSMTEPGMATRHEQYDERGNEIESWWMDGMTRKISRATYDGLGRVTSRLLAVDQGNGEDIQSLDRYHYDVHSGHSAQAPGDLIGRLSWAETDGVGKVFYGYDVLGRASSTSYLLDGHDQLVTEASLTLPGGRLDELRLITPYGRDELRYGYDSAGRMRRVTRDDGTELVDLKLVEAKGRPRIANFGNAVSEQFTYAPSGREELLAWTTSTRAGDYGQETLKLDGAGRVKAELHTTPTDNTGYLYSHDGLGRVDNVTKVTGLIPEVEFYTHDPLGNLLTRDGTTGITPLVYEPDNAVDPDRLCRAAAPGTTGPCQFKYDGAGNVVTDKSGNEPRYVTYDAGQRIQAITRGEAKVSLTHGPVGRAHTVVQDGTGTREVWHFGLVEERWHDGEKVIERKIPGPLGAMVSLRTADRGGQLEHTVIYAHGDSRANRLFTDEQGDVVQSATYGTYGQTTTTSTGAALTESHDLWNGGDNFPEVGVVLLGPRAYDPELGRFLQRDPLAVVLRASTANPYAFAFSNPVDFSDPTGLSGEGPSSSSSPSRWTTATAGGLVVYGLMRAFGYEENDPTQAVGASGFRPMIGQRLVVAVLTMERCDALCSFGRDVSDAGGAVAGSYGDYIKGKYSALYDMAGDVASGAWDSVKCGAQGAYCIYTRVVEGPDKVKTMVRVVAAMPDAARAAAADPLRLLCGGDCGFDDLGHAEATVAMAVVSQESPELAAKALEAAEKLAKALKKMKRTRLSRNWVARDISDLSCSDGCDRIAKQIEKLIGGEIVTIEPRGTPLLGSYRGKNLNWRWHDVVVKDGRVYDIFTGHKGASISDYKSLWEDADAIDFGF